jgi:acylphosphatase
LIARRLLVRGRVQGVWFRGSCQRQAAAGGVAGWVRNLHDGDVEVWLEGDQTAVENMMAWCRLGPSGAVVTAVQVEERQPEGLTSFRIID